MNLGAKPMGSEFFHGQSTLISVIPAQAGIQTRPSAWKPFFNGMTDAARHRGVYVLLALQKRTRKTLKRETDLARDG